MAGVRIGAKESADIAKSEVQLALNLGRVRKNQPCLVRGSRHEWVG